MSQKSLGQELLRNPALWLVVILMNLLVANLVCGILVP